MSGRRWPCCKHCADGHMEDHSTPCGTCAPKAHHCVWFRENSNAQAALARVRELCNEWAAAGGIHRFHADLVRDAIDGEDT